MIAILEKTEHNIDFHQIVDFLEASHIRYALTISPTVYVSHIRQFWSTARIETMNEEIKILATVDGKPRTISESLLRRHLKLNDEEGISSLPDTELFENLSLMGYNILQNQRFTFQKGQFSHQWKFLIHTIMQCLSSKTVDLGEGNSKYQTGYKDKEKELWVELKRLFEPEFEDQLWTHNQAFMHDPLEWKLYDTCGVHHVFTKDREIFMLVEKDYPLRKGLATVMICNKLQVEQYSQMANDLILKIHNIVNSPR
nr:hypothetical protein [Tanacetum cinerariifolium]